MKKFGTRLLALSFMFTAGGLLFAGILPTASLFELELDRAGGNPERLDFVSENPATVFIFLAEGCRISQDYSLTLRSLHKTFAPQGLQFRGVFPNAFSSDSSVCAYRTKYKIPFPLLLDHKQQLTKSLAARITPEAIVVLPSGQVAYRGRIDDLFYALGRKRSNISSHDLRDALHDIIAGRSPAVAETKAIGCLIERPK